MCFPLILKGKMFFNKNLWCLQKNFCVNSVLRGWAFVERILENEERFKSLWHQTYIASSFHSTFASLFPSNLAKLYIKWSHRFVSATERDMFPNFLSWLLHLFPTVLFHDTFWPPTNLSERVTDRKIQLFVSSECCVPWFLLCWTQRKVVPYDQW